jgi:antitoxin CptB
MKELDLKLQCYLETCWPDAPEPERDTFRRLLDAQDPEIWSWLLARSVPPDPELTTLIQRLRAL